MAGKGVVGFHEHIVDRMTLFIVHQVDQAERIVHGFDQRMVRLLQALPQQVVFGDVVADHQHPVDAGFVLDRAVAVGPPYVFAAAVAGQRDQAVFVPGAGAFAHDALDVRSDQVPGFFPARAAGLAEGELASLMRQLLD